MAHKVGDRVTIHAPQPGMAGHHMHGLPATIIAVNVGAYRQPVMREYGSREDEIVRDTFVARADDHRLFCGFFQEFRAATQPPSDSPNTYR